MAELIPLKDEDRRAAVRAAAADERKRIRDEGRREGVEHGHALGVYHARRMRDVACVAIGLIAGLALGALGTASLVDRAIMVGGAVTGGVLEHTIAEPARPLEPTPFERAAMEGLEDEPPEKEPNPHPNEPASWP